MILINGGGTENPTTGVVETSAHMIEGGDFTFTVTFPDGTYAIGDTVEFVTGGSVDFDANPLMIEVGDVDPSTNEATVQFESHDGFPNPGTFVLELWKEGSQVGIVTCDVQAAPAAHPPPAPVAAAAAHHHPVPQAAPEAPAPKTYGRGWWVAVVIVSVVLVGLAWCATDLMARVGEIPDTLRCATVGEPCCDPNTDACPSPPEPAAPAAPVPP